MSRSGLKTLAVILGILIVVVLFAGLDDLPRPVRAQIDTERTALAAAQTKFNAARAEVARDLESEPALFQAVDSSRQWPGQFDSAAAGLALAGRDMDELSRLEKANRRQDRQRVEALLAHERGLRTSALGTATAAQADAAHWIDFKQHLPEALQEMAREHAAIDGANLAPADTAVQRADTDWPDKKADLDARLAAVHGLVSQADQAWNSSAGARSEAAAGNYSVAAALAGPADTLKTDSDALPKKTAELQALTGQLYNAWDKVLVDMEVRGSSGNRTWDQKIRTIQTHFANAADKSGKVTSDEKWVEVPSGVYEAQKNDLGMSVAHKAAGKYDSEAETVAQPAGFAYMATPAQGSNQYGHWERRDGHDFWVFYGQYALLRDLLFNYRYRDLERRDWDQYRDYRDRGQTYYGRDEASGGQKYGSQGSSTQQRYSDSTYAKKGGFGGSKYASKSGSYRDSQYASPSARQGGDASGRSFGKSSGRGEPHFGAPPSRSYRPAPRPSYRPPSRSFGRSFGRRR
jgi:hypothetical protein